MIDDWGWPFPIHKLTLDILRRLEIEGIVPERIEVLFGDETLEILGRELARRVTAVTQFMGIPVTFPEKPGPRLGILEVRALSPAGGAEAGIDAGIVLDDLQRRLGPT